MFFCCCPFSITHCLQSISNGFEEKREKAFKKKVSKKRWQYPFPHLVQLSAHRSRHSHSLTEKNIGHHYPKTSLAHTHSTRSSKVSEWASERTSERRLGRFGAVASEKRPAKQNGSLSLSLHLLQAQPVRCCCVLLAPNKVKKTFRAGAEMESASAR